MRMTTTMALSAALAATACAGAETSEHFGASSVPWDSPGTERATPSLARASAEVVPHGVQVVDRRGGEVVVLSMVEVHNPSAGAIAMPDLEIVAELADTSGRSGCAPAGPLVGASDALRPGERRFLWAQVVCQVSDAPAVVRVTARGPDGATALGEAIVLEPTPRAATAAR